MESVIPDIDEYIGMIKKSGEPWTGVGTMQYMKMLNLQRSALPMRDISACNLGLLFNEISRTPLEERIAHRKRDAELRGPKTATLPSGRDTWEDL